MRSTFTLTLILVALLPPLAPAQTRVQTLPAGYSTKPGNLANFLPWSGKFLKNRCMWVWDSRHINSTKPVVISRLRWRVASYAKTWPSGHFPNIEVNMSTCPVDFKNASPTFANNHGPDLFQVYKGYVFVTSQTHANGRWYVDIKLTHPFKYDPTKGDLTIEVIQDLNPSGVFAPCDYLQDSQVHFYHGCNRIINSTSATAPTGTVHPLPAIIEITWQTAIGVFPNFKVDRTVGGAPCKVNFTDISYSSDPGGIKSWAWDFNGDMKIDSTLQNPSFTYLTGYRTCVYDVSLSITDKANPTGKMIVKKAMITVDPPPKADFEATPKVGKAPLFVQFTDKSVGPTQWAWDFDNDNIVDSTLQNPRHGFAPGSYSVKLTITNVTGTDSVVKKNYIMVGVPNTWAFQPDLLQFQFNEVRSKLVSNTGSDRTISRFGLANYENWQTDAGRSRFMGKAKGTGCLGNTMGVDTGWAPNLKGDHTIMFWFRPRSMPGYTTIYFFKSSPLTCSTGGLLGRRIALSCPTIGDIKANYVMPGPIGKWVHCALVIDDAAGAAKWYFDGKLDSTTPFTPNSFSVQGKFPLTIGTKLPASTATRFFDIDDFRIYSRAMPANQITVQATQEVASTGTFGAGCGNAMIKGQGLPFLGNSTFAINVENSPNMAPGVILLGVNPTKYLGTYTLPFDLGFLFGNGCKLYTGIIQSTSFLTSANGAASLPLPIPIIHQCAGTHLYVQALVVGTKTVMSPGLDVNIQH